MRIFKVWGHIRPLCGMGADCLCCHGMGGGGDDALGCVKVGKKSKKKGRKLTSVGHKDYGGKKMEKKRKESWAPRGGGRREERELVVGCGCV